LGSCQRAFTRNRHRLAVPVLDQRPTSPDHPSYLRHVCARVSGTVIGNAIIKSCQRPSPCFCYRRRSDARIDARTSFALPDNPDGVEVNWPLRLSPGSERGKRSLAAITARTRLPRRESLRFFISARLQASICKFPRLADACFCRFVIGKFFAEQSMRKRIDD